MSKREDRKQELRTGRIENAKQRSNEMVEEGRGGTLTAYIACLEDELVWAEKAENDAATLVIACKAAVSLMKDRNHAVHRGAAIGILESAITAHELRQKARESA